MKIEFEKDVLKESGFISGTTKGWAAQTWAGDAGIPDSYNFKIYSPEPGRIKVDIMVLTSAGHFRVIKVGERGDLKIALAKHYQARFPGCELVLR